jgi:hypothetical protein
VYGVPEDLDLQFLHGAEVIEVCIGLYQVQFIFHPEANVSVEGAWILYAAHGSQLDRSRPSPRQEPFSIASTAGATGGRNQRVLAKLDRFAI